MYHRTSSFVFDRAFPNGLRELLDVRVNYGQEEARNLGEYFLKMEKSYPMKEITPRLLTHRLPGFSELE